MFEEHIEKWSWTIEPVTFWAFIGPILGLLAFFVAATFLFHHYNISLANQWSGHIIEVRKARKTKVRLIAVPVIMSLAFLGFSGLYAFNNSYLKDNSPKHESVQNEYLTAEGTVTSSTVSATTFLNDRTKEVTLRVKENPDVLIKVSDDKSIAKFLNRENIETGTLYCKKPDSHKNLTFDCSLDKDNIVWNSKEDQVPDEYKNDDGSADSSIKTNETSKWSVDS